MNQMNLIEVESPKVHLRGIDRCLMTVKGDGRGMHGRSKKDVTKAVAKFIAINGYNMDKVFKHLKTCEVCDVRDVVEILESKIPFGTSPSKSFGEIWVQGVRLMKEKGFTPNQDFYERMFQDLGILFLTSKYKFFGPIRVLQYALDNGIQKLNHPRLNSILQDALNNNVRLLSEEEYNAYNQTYKKNLLIERIHAL